MNRLVISNVKTPFHLSEDSFSISINGETIDQVGKITAIQKDDFVFEFESALVTPGLFNAHDHLEFSLFPRLGRKLYQNYIEWGNDIHLHFKNEIDEVLQIPVADRWRLGILKNVLSGVTTVIDHGFPAPHKSNFIIDVQSNFQYIHSLATDKRWKLKINLPQAEPVMAHVGEGVDPIANDELRKVFRWNFLNRKIIAVHLISGDQFLAKQLAAMIWCPDSNLFLYGKTAQVSELKKNVPIFLGTDSPLTASDNFWDHLRLAKSTGFVSDLELYEMVTKTPSNFFKLNNGSISPGMKADLVFFKMKSSNTINSFFESNPEDILLVIKNGRVVVFDEMLKKQLEPFLKSEFFEPLNVNGSVKLLKGNWSELIQGISKNNIRLPLGISRS